MGPGQRPGTALLVVHAGVGMHHEAKRSHGTVLEAASMENNGCNLSCDRELEQKYEPEKRVATNGKHRS